MNDVGGSESGRGLRAVKSSRTSDSNFEYDDSEWDVGIGNLIIDLDADIEKTNEATRSGSSSNSSGGGTPTPSLQNLVRSSTHPSVAGPKSQMHIPQSPASTSTSANNLSKGKSSTTAATGSSVLPLIPPSPGKTPTPSSSESTPSSTNSVISISMEHTTMSDKGLKMKIKRSKPGTKSVDARHEIVKSDVLAAGNSGSSASATKSSSSINNETKSSSSNVPSQKDGKEAKSLVEKDSPLDVGCQNDPNSAKAKAVKRTTSTHKKVKLATGVTASIVSTKKEVIPADSKSSTSTTTINAPLGNSHGKDGFNSTNPSSHSNIGSAFVKTSASSNIKIPSHGSILGNDLTSVNSSPAGSTSNCRALHNSTTHSHSSSSASIPHTQLTTTASPSKTDRSGVSSSVTNTPSASEKGSSHSPSYGKKPRVGSNSTEKVGLETLSSINLIFKNLLKCLLFV